jgi:hypothetical protein
VRSMKTIGRRPLSLRSFHSGNEDECNEAAASLLCREITTEVISGIRQEYRSAFPSALLPTESRQLLAVSR